jgi:hypothetical protein
MTISLQERYNVWPLLLDNTGYERKTIFAATEYIVAEYAQGHRNTFLVRSNFLAHHYDALAVRCSPGHVPR